jgi:hypothetical protein
VEVLKKATLTIKIREGFDNIFINKKYKKWDYLIFLKEKN